LPGVATGARGNCAALKRIAPQDANLIVIAHQALELAQDHLPHELRQMIIQCIPVYLKCVILATLTLIDQRIVVVLRQGGVQIRPATAGSTENFAAHGRIATELPDQSPQFRRRHSVSARATHEHLLESVGARMLGASDKPMLTIPCNRQQLAEGHNGVAVVHGAPLDFGTARFASRRDTAFVIPDAAVDAEKSALQQSQYARQEFFSRPLFAGAYELHDRRRVNE
jgi:hypothetical protein